MWNNGHNRGTAAALAVVAALTLGATPALAQETSSDSTAPKPLASIELNSLSSRANIVIPQLPDIEVPRGLVDGAKKVGIALPERITIGPRTSHVGEVQVATTETTEERLVEESNKQLTKEGHRKDPEAQAIAEQWAQQAVRGEAVFTGDVGRGTTGTDRGTGQIYKLNPADAAQRIGFLNKEEVIDAVETTPTKDPKRYGVAAAHAGDIIYLVEYFLN